MTELTLVLSLFSVEAEAFPFVFVAGGVRISLPYACLDNFKIGWARTTMDRKTWRGVEDSWGSISSLISGILASRPMKTAPGNRAAPHSLESIRQIRTSHAAEYQRSPDISVLAASPRKQKCHVLHYTFTRCLEYDLHLLFFAPLPPNFFLSFCFFLQFESVSSI